MLGSVPRIARAVLFADQMLFPNAKLIHSFISLLPTNVKTHSLLHKTRSILYMLRLYTITIMLVSK